MDNDPVFQAAAIYKTLADFFLEESNSASSSVDSPAPTEFRDHLSNIDFSELLRVSLNEQSSNPSFANGASLDTIHHASALLREHDMCKTRKIDYSIDRASSAAIESTFISNRGLLIDAQLRGTSR